MIQMIVLALTLSWDSFVIGLLDGSLCISGPRVLRVLALFSVCEGGAVGVGIWLGHTPAVQFAQIADLLFWASLLLVFLVTFQKRKKDSLSISRSVYLLPVLLSADNFVLGPAFTAVRVRPAVCVLTVGATSAAIFGVGIICGRAGRGWLTRRSSIHPAGTGCSSAE